MCLASVACIIAIVGRQPPEAHASPHRCLLLPCSILRSQSQARQACQNFRKNHEGHDKKARERAVMLMKAARFLGRRLFDDTQASFADWLPSCFAISSTRLWNPVSTAIARRLRCLPRFVPAEISSDLPSLIYLSISYSFPARHNRTSSFALLSTASGGCVLPIGGQS